MAFFVFSVMSEFSLDDPGFTPPVLPVPPSSISSVETPVDGRRIVFRVLCLPTRLRVGRVLLRRRIRR